MGLKALLKSLDGLPEELQQLYVKVGDDFVLDVDDKDFKDRLGEFRANNIELSNEKKEWSEQAQELEQLRETVAKYKDIDPDKAREAMEKMSHIEEKKLIDAGRLDEVVEQRIEQRVERMRADYEGQIRALTSNNEELQKKSENLGSRLSEVVIDNSLQHAVSKVAQVKQGAMRDIISRGRESWRLDEKGQPVPYGADGDVVYGKDGKQPITMEEWAQSLVQEAGYLFEPNSGGGASGNTRSQGDGLRILDASDTDAVNASLESIASGEVQVRQS